MNTTHETHPLPPGYWFGAIKYGLRDKMRAGLSDLGLSRGEWRILHTLADGPQSADAIEDALPPGERHRRMGPRGFGFEYDRDRDHDRDHEHGRRDYHHGGSDQDGRSDTDGHSGHDHPHHDHDHDSHQAHGHESHQAHDHESHQAHGHEPLHHNYDHNPSHHDTAHDNAAHDNAAHDGHHHGRDAHDGHHHGRGQHHGHDRRFAADGVSARRDGTARDGRRRPRSVQEVLDGFAERGWVTIADGVAELTDEGRAAHDAAFARVRELRASFAEGIDEADYATTMATLERMARNLGWDESQPWDRGRRE